MRLFILIGSSLVAAACASGRTALASHTSIPVYQDPDGIYVSPTPETDTLPRVARPGIGPNMPRDIPEGSADHLVAAFVIGIDGRAEVGTMAVLEEPKHAGVTRSVCEYLPQMKFVAAHPHGVPVRTLVVMPFRFQVGEPLQVAEPDVARYQRLVVTIPRAELFTMLAEHRGCARAA